MTIDEAIKHAEEVAEKNERMAESVRNRPISSADFYHEEESCSKCAKEHRKLAEWLNELKQLREQTSWIPVSERLPEDYQRVLVTIVNYAGYKVVRVAEYNSGKETFQIKENHERWKVGEKGLLAWMPLPESFSEGEYDSN